MDKTINRLFRSTGVPKSDIEQEIGLKIDKIKASYDGRIDFEQYLYICMRRHLSRRKKEVKTVPMDVMAVFEDTGRNMDNDYFMNVLREKLSRDDLYLVFAKFYEGRRVVDLAKERGCSTSNIYLKFKNIRDKMKALKLDILYQRGER